LTGGSPQSRPGAVSRARRNDCAAGPLVGANEEGAMKIRTKTAVFDGDSVTTDMLLLTLRAVVVGTGVASVAALLVAGFVALIA
jgi:hypothetical protein